MVIQFKLLKYFADYQKGGKNILELLQDISKNKNDTHKSLALGEPGACMGWWLVTPDFGSLAGSLILLFLKDIFTAH